MSPTELKVLRFLEEAESGDPAALLVMRAIVRNSADSAPDRDLCRIAHFIITMENKGPPIPDATTGEQQ